MPVDVAVGGEGRRGGLVGPDSRLAVDEMRGAHGKVVMPPQSNERERTSLMASSLGPTLPSTRQ